MALLKNKSDLPNSFLIRKTSNVSKYDNMRSIFSHSLSTLSVSDGTYHLRGPVRWEEWDRVLKLRGGNYQTTFSFIGARTQRNTTGAGLYVPLLMSTLHAALLCGLWCSVDLTCTLFSVTLRYEKRTCPWWRSFLSISCGQRMSYVYTVKPSEANLRREHLFWYYSFQVSLLP